MSTRAPRDHPASVPSRRVFLGAALGGAAIVLTPMTFAAAATGSSVTKTITGHLDPGAADFVYLPVEVPRGVNRISVSYTYDRPAVAPGLLGNSCDIGIFDQKGVDVGGRGFRGWSGGFRTEFTISAADATPGYLPGPIGRGTWNVVLGPYTVSDVGLTYTVTVTLDYGSDAAATPPAYPALTATGRGRSWYRGDAHLHTVHSDGRRTPAEVAAGARAAHMDFIVSTDHNTSSSHAVWGPLAGADLLILVGEEITTRNGHYLAVGLKPSTWVDWRYRSGERGYDQAARTIHSDGALLIPAHPYCAYVGCRWKFGYEEADGIELWNGPWTADDESAVDTWDAMLVEAVRGKRRWLPAIGNSDAHSDGQVIGLPHNVVLADALSRDAVLAGMRAGTSWIAESAAVEVSLSATAEGRSAGIGERLEVRPEVPVTITAAASGVPNGVVRLITDEGQMQQVSLPAAGSGTLTWRTTAQVASYVRLEVRHPLADGTPGNGAGMGPQLQLGPMAALTNPIFLGDQRR